MKSVIGEFPKFKFERTKIDKTVLIKNRSPRVLLFKQKGILGTATLERKKLTATIFPKLSTPPNVHE